MQQRQPNILMLTLESTPASHVSCYGYARQTTPHIDRFAAEGALYEQAIAPACWTLPAHASLFTGLYPSQHGTHFGNPFLSKDVVTIAELLQRRGYATAAFTTNDWVNERFGFDRGFETFRWSKRTMEWLKSLFSAETKAEKVIRYARDPFYPVGHRNNKLIKAWIKQSRQTGRPFFAYTLYFEPHYPYRPHYPYAREFLKDTQRPWWRVNMDPDRYMAGAATMTADDFEVINGLYDSRLAGTDAIIGRLLDDLRQDGILDDTIVIIVADHGENLGEHQLMSHQYCVYDTLAHIPLIIRYPRLFPAGMRITETVQSLELFTTIIDIIGIDREEIPNQVLGRSLVPENIADKPLPFAVTEYLVSNLARMKRLYPDKDLSRYDRQLRAIRQDGWKAIFASSGTAELYHVTEDAGEIHDLADVHPEHLARLQTLLQDWLLAVGAPQTIAANGSKEELDADLVKRLQDLGYF
ncbi:MAG: sulfatase-like hydrolase/transferase [Anaerolineae bacterium]|nr:sulfatase-like hydrolase/transferase [Anaerolineae bacterium]